MSSNEANPGKLRDVHKLMTHMFNVELNSFISHRDEIKKTGETVNTEGDGKIIVTESSSLQPYAEKLYNFRENLFRKSEDFYMKEKELIKELDSLLDFSLSLKNIECQKQVQDELVVPLIIFFDQVDDIFGNDYYSKRFYIELTVKLVTLLGLLPVKDRLIEFYYLDKKLKEIKAGECNTNSMGCVSVTLLKGRYKIIVDGKIISSLSDFFLSEKRQISLLELGTGKDADLKVYEPVELTFRLVTFLGLLSAKNRLIELYYFDDKINGVKTTEMKSDNMGHSSVSLPTGRYKIVVDGESKINDFSLFFKKEIVINVGRLPMIFKKNIF